MKKINILQRIFGGKKLTSNNNSNYTKCRKELVKYFDSNIIWKDCDVEEILKRNFM